MRNYDELILSANIAMLEKLKENEHKPGFDKVSFEYGLKRLDEERKELRLAVINYIHHPSIDTLKEVRREAADCANFPAMIILKCDKMIAELEGKA